jgi:hypothetical protein
MDMQIISYTEKYKTLVIVIKLQNISTVVNKNNKKCDLSGLNNVIIWEDFPGCIDL